MVSPKHRRLQLERRRREHPAQETGSVRPAAPAQAPREAKRSWMGTIYHDHYKLLFLITIGLLIGSLAVIGLTYARTGDVIYKGVSLSGGLTVTIPSQGAALSVDELSDLLASRLPGADISIREISDLGTQAAVVIEAAPALGAGDDIEPFERALLGAISELVPDVRDRATIEIVGSSLGRSFFQQTARAILVAFVLMGLVVFMYFGETKTQKAAVLLVSIVEGLVIWYASGIVSALAAIAFAIVLGVMYVRWSVPSAAVILAAISTLLFTVAVVDLMQLRISTAGIAAFLMLIGYSVDTDILLSTRVLKQTAGTVYDRVCQTIKTGLTMEGTTIAAALVSIIFTQSDVIREIMTIILIGLIADIPFTWIQNAGILRLHLEKKGIV